MEMGQEMNFVFSHLGDGCQATYPCCNRDCGNACVTLYVCQHGGKCRTHGWESLETPFFVSLPLVWSVTWVKSCFM